jgi:hypothetical protein
MYTSCIITTAILFVYIAKEKSKPCTQTQEDMMIVKVVNALENEGTLHTPAEVVRRHQPALVQGLSGVFLQTVKKMISTT